MEIAFTTKELRDLCHDEVTLDTRLNAFAAEVLKIRLADLCAAEWIGEVLAGQPKQGQWKNSECYFFELDDKIVLVLIPNHLKQRVNHDGKTDWTKIQRVKVVYLGERNDLLS